MSKRGEDREETGSRGFPLPLWGSSEKLPVFWTIAGFDPSSGAGITADLMTFAAHGGFGCSAITALTVQSTLGVFGWEAIAPDLLRETLRRLEEDIPPAGIKLGMLGTPEAAEAVGTFVGAAKTRDRGRSCVVVYDPVLRSSSGQDLFPAEELPALHGGLLPWVDWITPNWRELALLSACPVHDLPSAEAAARGLIVRHPQLTVVVTGGDQERPTDFLVIPGQEAVVIEGQHIPTRATHGTGCAFSSALLVRLVEGCGPVQAVRWAKAFVEGALRHAPGMGHGRGPMGLLWTLQDRAIATLEG